MGSRSARSGLSAAHAPPLGLAVRTPSLSRLARASTLSGSAAPLARTHVAASRRIASGGGSRRPACACRARPRPLAPRARSELACTRRKRAQSSGRRGCQRRCQSTRPRAPQARPRRLPPKSGTAGTGGACPEGDRGGQMRAAAAWRCSSP
eukprot:20394-Rhodomonas_salina.2